MTARGHGLGHLMSKSRECYVNGLDMASSSGHVKTHARLGRYQSRNESSRGSPTADYCFEVFIIVTWGPDFPPFRSIHNVRNESLGAGSHS